MVAALEVLAAAPPVHADDAPEGATGSRSISDPAAVDAAMHKGDLPARVMGFVVPDLAGFSPAHDETVTVDFRAHIRNDGTVADVTIDSAPSPLDDAVRKAVAAWIVVPPTCPKDSGVNPKYEMHASLLISSEGGDHYVALHQPRFRYVGEPSSTSAAGASSSTQPTNRLQGHLAEIKYPLDVIRKRVEWGVLYARLDIRADGSVEQVTIPFAQPPHVFDESVIEALEQSRFDPEPKPWSACVQVNFRLE
ncbi:MAG: energy transducer TonB [Proteobacteria bacterium]|nr:energy transducer TonB [Pseudomonadota bacterium]